MHQIIQIEHSVAGHKLQQFNRQGSREPTQQDLPPAVRPLPEQGKQIPEGNKQQNIQNDDLQLRLTAD